MRYKVKAFINTNDAYEGQEPYPWIGKPFMGEMGPMGKPDVWDMRIYSMFLFRRCVGIEVSRK